MPADPSSRVTKDCPAGDLSLKNAISPLDARFALVALAGFALALFGLCEVGMAYPVAWWLYLCVALAFAAGLLRPVSIRSQLSRLGALVAGIAVIATLYFVEWTTRKPFLRDLHRLRVGMAEAEVRRIMGRYMEGTGWPANPFDGSTNATGATPGEGIVREALIFRHSTDDAFNSDWGIVSLSSGKVLKVEFSAD